MAEISWALPGLSPHPQNHRASRIVLLALLIGLANLVSGIRVNEKKSLNDVTVHEGDKARFLCYTSHLSQQQHQQPPQHKPQPPPIGGASGVASGAHSQNNKDKNRVNDGDNVTVVWTFQDQPVYFDLALDIKDQRIKSISYEDRRVLEIGHVRKSDAGEYTCTVTSPNGKEEAFQGVLTVQSAPDPPIEVTAKCHGNSASLTWRPGNNNGAEIRTFAIQFNISDKPDTWFDYYEDIPGKNTEAYIELSPYGVYSFRVLATNEVGTSQPSNVTSRMCRTPMDRPDRNPPSVWTKTDKKGYLVVEWEPLNRLSFHGRKFHYIVLWRLKGSLAWNSANVTGSYTTTWAKKVEQVYSVFELQVKAANEMGEAHHPPFNYVGRSFEDEPLVSVSNLRVDHTKNITSNTAHLVWEAIDPTDPKVRGKFRGYKIVYSRYYVGQDREVKVSVLIPGHGLTAGQDVKATISDLPANSMIRFHVVVANSHYLGPPSNEIDIYTPEGVPSAVGGLFADSVTASSIVLRWLPPQEPNGVLTGFDIGIQQVLGNRLSKPKVVLGDDPYQLRRRLEGLKADTRYRIHLAAKTKVGQGDFSFIDVQTGKRRSNTGANSRKNPRQSDAGTPTGQIPTASRKESPYDTDRMQPDNMESGACWDGVSTRHSIFIMAASLLSFLTAMAGSNWS